MSVPADSKVLTQAAATAMAELQRNAHETHLGQLPVQAVMGQQPWQLDL